MSNPLLATHALPPFNEVKVEDILLAIETLIQENKQQVSALESITEPSWNNLVQPLEDLANRLENAWSPVRHLNSVCNQEQLRIAYEKCISLLSDYHTELGQNEKLYGLFLMLSKTEEFPYYSQAQRKIIEDTLLNFKLSGVNLDSEKKQRYKTIQQRLAQLTTTFENNVLDSTNAWFHQVTDEAQLAGLPEHAIKAAEIMAKSKELSGWVFNLEFPSYYPIISYAHDRELRKLFYTAYTTRASAHFAAGSQWDNSQIMEEILQLRYELANLLGFETYAHLSLATKMVKEPTTVLSFLTDLAHRSKPYAQKEMAELADYAASHLGVKELQAWDLAYASEKLKEYAYAINNEMLRPYFPENKVLTGLFKIVETLYQVKIHPRTEVETWHPDVKAFGIYSSNDNKLIATFYFDLYARPHKRGGAWMDDCRARHLDASKHLQLPAAYLTCNFTSPQNQQEALFTHEEVLTLFHEFGHGLHHMLTQIDYISVSGINGVEWDAVELPSQFMEHFCWEKAALNLIAQHYQSHEPLPDELYVKMLKAKNYHSAMQMLRQLEFSLFDFRIHFEYRSKEGARIQEILDEVRKEVSVVPVPAFNRFQHSFSHIFAGGYAAGYYSYKWAEVLASDAYSRFEEEGILNPQTGRAFWQCILAKGGSEDAEKLFIDFRGRKPTIDAFLRHNGLS